MDFDNSSYRLKFNKLLEYRNNKIKTSETNKNQLFFSKKSENEQEEDDTEIIDSYIYNVNLFFMI
jgi:hypothetical protein